MSDIKKWILIFMSCLFSLLNIDTVYASDIVIEITTEEKQINNDVTREGNPIYKTDEPIIKSLPQTDEVVVSFVYFLIGLSLIILVLGIYMNKFYMNTLEVRWDY